MYKQIYFVLLIALAFIFSSCNQSEINNESEQNSDLSTCNSKNIILMIGDGMGIAQVQAAMTANNNQLNMERCTHTGFSKTSSADNYITDSAASGTAMATGTKTYNGAIAVDMNKNLLKTILEIAEDNHLATGLVATSTITHATPASFIAHNENRGNYEQIAEDFLKTDIDVFIGGGRNHFAVRDDNADLTTQLKENDYQMVYDQSELETITEGKIAALLADDAMPFFNDGRGNMLEVATSKAIEILSQNQKGFFLMVEASQIDWAGHQNNQDNVVAETIDFDRAIKVALDFAETNKNTLVIVTADHETGGVTVTGGNKNDNQVALTFSSGGHTAVMVPVFAYGPGAELFSGVYENTAIFDKMLSVFGFRKQVALVK